MTGREERIARNETLFREVNERVKELVPSEGGIDFICECGNEECIEQVRLTADEYEHVRADPIAFFLKPGHETPGVEEVVDGNERYLLVRKRVEEREIARQTDPRA